MEIRVLNKDKDGYISAKVKDEHDNFLSYIYSPLNGWLTSYGRIDNKEFRGNKTLRYNWDKQGRGRASEETWDKLINLHNYFWENKSSI